MRQIYILIVKKINLIYYFDLITCKVVLSFSCNIFQNPPFAYSDGVLNLSLQVSYSIIVTYVRKVIIFRK